MAHSFSFSKKLARESKIHSYGKSFNGFVARLLPHEAEKLLGTKLDEYQSVHLIFIQYYILIFRLMQRRRMWYLCFQIHDGNYTQQGHGISWECH